MPVASRISETADPVDPAHPFADQSPSSFLPPLPNLFSLPPDVLFLTAFPSPQWISGPKSSYRRSGERCELPQLGPVRSLDRKSILVSFEPRFLAATTLVLFMDTKCPSEQIGPIAQTAVTSSERTHWQPTVQNSHHSSGGAWNFHLGGRLWLRQYGESSPPVGSGGKALFGDVGIKSPKTAKSQSVRYCLQILTAETIKIWIISQNSPLDSWPVCFTLGD